MSGTWLVCGQSHGHKAGVPQYAVHVGMGVATQVGSGCVSIAYTFQVAGTFIVQGCYGAPMLVIMESSSVATCAHTQLR